MPPVQYKDYYKILGLEKKATTDEIKKAYRKLATKYHPDRNAGDKRMEAKFREINEAYEVLKDPEKRQRYDTLGSAGFQGGQPFNPEDFSNIFGGRARGRHPGAGGPGGPAFSFETGGSGFSDFFETLFGGGGARGAAGGRGGTMFDFSNQADPFGSEHEGHHHARHAAESPHLETELTIPLADAYRGTMRRITFARTENGGEPSRQNYQVKIPAGIREGQKVRLKGQGGGTPGRTGDILIKIRISEDPHYTLENDDLVAELPLAAWEAALGGKISVPTLEGPVEVKVPAGIRTGQRLRVRDHGWPKKEGGKGDLLLKIKILVPPKLTDQERELFEKLERVSDFKPRG